MEDKSYIGFYIDTQTKNKFVELCEKNGSNMSVELKRFIINKVKNDLD